VAAVVCIVFLFSVVLIPFAKADWTMFHADISNSGAATGNPALTPTLLWNYPSGGNVYSSPAVVDGVLYFGSYDNNVYALGALSTPTPSPTASPSSSPTPTASPSSTTPGFPDQFILLLGIIIVVIVVIIVVAMVLKRRTKETSKSA
jgi:hypothetical protein